jgi:hypothetical protein
MVSCEIELEPGALDHVQAKMLEDRLRAALADIFPERRVAGLWIHEKPGSDRIEGLLAQLREEKTARRKDVDHLLERVEVYRKTMAEVLNAVKSYDYEDDSRALGALRAAGKVLRGES